MKKLLIRFLEKYLYLTQFLINEEMTREKIRRYNSLFRGKILDIGAGEKPYHSLFLQADAYIGTNTRRHYKNTGREIDDHFTDVWIEDGSALPFPDASFDGVVNFQVLSVIAEPEIFFREVYRVLKLEGMFMLSTDFIYPKWSPEDVMRHSDAHLKILAEKTGFEVIAQESYGGFHTMFYSLFLRYVRSYPQILKDKSTVMKILSAFYYFFLLLGQPFLSLYGRIMYLFERKNVNAFDFTMNTLLIARKK